MPEEMYTPEEISTRLKVNIRTVYGWIRRGKLKSTKLGNLLRISEEDYNQFLADGRKSAEG